MSKKIRAAAEYLYGLGSPGIRSEKPRSVAIAALEKAIMNADMILFQYLFSAAISGKEGDEHIVR
jgi:hypothetical protein